MGASKTEHYLEQQKQVANIAKALGHPARIAIIEYLLTVDSCICNDIVDALPLAQPSISRHLKELKEAGLIDGKTEGNTISYYINPITFGFLKNYFSKIIFSITKQNCC